MKIVLGLGLLFLLSGGCSADDSLDSAMDSSDESGGKVTFYEICSADRCSEFATSRKLDIVSTWHDEDKGIDLGGAPVTLSIMHTGPNPPVLPDGGADPDEPLEDFIWECYKIEMLVKKDESTTLMLKIDQGTDLKIDEPINITEWDTFSAYIAPAELRKDIRFSLERTGVGEAVLYYWEIESLWGNCPDGALVVR